MTHALAGVLERQTGRLEVPVSYFGRVGSSPISRTIKPLKLLFQRFFVIFE